MMKLPASCASWHVMCILELAVAPLSFMYLSNAGFKPTRNDIMGGLVNTVSQFLKENDSDVLVTRNGMLFTGYQWIINICLKIVTSVTIRFTSNYAMHSYHFLNGIDMAFCKFILNLPVPKCNLEKEWAAYLCIT